MDPALAWRALEEPDGEARPAAADPPHVRSVDRRTSVIAVLIIAGAAAVLAAVVAMAPSPAAITLPGDGSAAAAITNPRASPVHGSGVSGGSPGPDGEMLVVDVAGAVARPGVYRLPQGSRVSDAVAAAGGFGPRVDAAAAARLNLASLLRDGQQVLVPSRDGPASGAGGPSSNPGSQGAPSVAPAQPIDLNAATAAELDALPGIGPVTAGKIIASRAESPFTSVDDLRTRKLVGESVFAKLGDLVTVGR